jgi:hypothetical protein
MPDEDRVKTYRSEAGRGHAKKQTQHGGGSGWLLCGCNSSRCHKDKPQQEVATGTTHTHVTLRGVTHPHQVLHTITPGTATTLSLPTASTPHTPVSHPGASPTVTRSSNSSLGREPLVFFLTAWYWGVSSMVGPYSRQRVLTVMRPSSLHGAQPNSGHRRRPHTQVKPNTVGINKAHVTEPVWAAGRMVHQTWCARGQPS